MNIHVVYNRDGSVVAVSMPDATNGQDMVSAPREGQSILKVDMANIKQELSCTDDEELGFAILDRCRVDAVGGRLILQ